MLPSGYTKLEYIEGTGQNYIDTGVSHNKTTVVRVVAEILNEQGQNPSILFGSTGFLMGTRNGQWYCVTFSSSTQGVADTNKHTFILDGNGYSYVDDLCIENREAASSSRSIYLFKTNGSSSGDNSTKRIYSARVTTDGIDTADLVPARRNLDSVVGFYDLVSDTFLTNAGSGTFSYGEYRFKVNVSSKPTSASIHVSATEVSLGTTVTMWARPLPDYNFMKWSDGVTSEYRSIVVEEDINLVAEYERIRDNNGIYQYRCYVKDQLHLTNAPKAFMMVNTFNVKTDLLTNANTSVEVFNVASNINEGDVLTLYSPTGEILYNGVVTSVEGTTINCAQMQSYYKGLWIYNTHSSTYLEQELAWLLGQYAQGKLFGSSYTDSLVAQRLGGLTIDYTGSNTVNLPTDTDEDGNDQYTQKDMEQFIYEMYESYGIVFRFEINFSGTNYVHIEVPTYDTMKVGNNMYAIQNMSSITEVEETNRLVIFNQDKTYRTTYVATKTGIVEAPSTTANRFNITNTKLVFSDDDSADLVAANLPEQMFNHKVEFDLILKNFIYEFKDFKIGGSLDIYMGGAYFNTVLTGYEISKAQNQNIVSVHFICGIVRKKLTQLLTMGKV